MSNTYRHNTQAAQRASNRAWRAAFHAGELTHFRGENHPLLTKVKHASDLKMCSCRLCTYGLHTPRNGVIVKAIRGGAKARVRDALLTGNYDAIQDAIWVPYTD